MKIFSRRPRTLLIILLCSVSTVGVFTQELCHGEAAASSTTTADPASPATSAASSFTTNDISDSNPPETTTSKSAGVTPQLAATGDLKNYETDLFSGRFKYSVPIKVAPARKSSQPSLALTYDSSGGIPGAAKAGIWIWVSSSAMAATACRSYIRPPATQRSMTTLKASNVPWLGRIRAW